VGYHNLSCKQTYNLVFSFSSRLRKFREHWREKSLGAWHAPARGDKSLVDCRRLVYVYLYTTHYSLHSLEVYSFSKR
jgi:hypothetical protein